MLAVAEKGAYGEKLKELRHRLRYTQEEMALRLGASRATYKNWEYGVANPPPLTVKELTVLESEAAAPTTPAYELEVPLLSIGSIAASEKVDWTDPFESETFEDVPGHMAGGRGRFSCRVASDSMMPLLMPEDVCIWQASNVPKVGGVILYRTADKLVTIKQLKHNGTHYYLHPLNSRYDDMDCDPDSGQIGFLVGVVRRIGKRVITDYDPDGIRHVDNF